MNVKHPRETHQLSDLSQALYCPLASAEPFYVRSLCNGSTRKFASYSYVIMPDMAGAQEQDLTR